MPWRPITPGPETKPLAADVLNELRNIGMLLWEERGFLRLCSCPFKVGLRGMRKAELGSKSGVKIFSSLGLGEMAPP